MTAPRLAQLSRRSGAQALPAIVLTAAGTVPILDTEPAIVAAFAEIMYGEAQGGCSWPRLVMLSSQAPADVFLQWTGGGGFGQRALLTVFGGSRVAIDARTVKVFARSRTTGANQFFSSIADGDQPTRNSWIAEWAQAAPPASGQVQVPPNAQGIRCASNRSAGSGASLQLLNAGGTIIGITPVINTFVQPAVVIGAAAVQIIGLAVGEIVTISFDLGL